MVHLSIVRACNDDLVKNHHITAVFVGGTSGIGEYTMRTLASTVGTSGRGLRAYIVGRNQRSADTIIADCRKLCPTGEFRFVKANDLSLITDVDRVCQEITNMETLKADGGQASIDLLVLSQAWFAFGGKLKRIALRRDENFGFDNFNSHAVFMTTFFFEKLAAAHQGKLSLSHCHPGLVETPALTGDGIPTWFKPIWSVATPLVKLASTSQEEVGDRMLLNTSPRYPAKSSGAKKEMQIQGKSEKIKVAISSDGVLGGGCYRNNSSNESVPLGKPYNSIRVEEVREKVWEHTMNVFEDISTKGH